MGNIRWAILGALALTLVALYFTPEDHKKSSEGSESSTIHRSVAQMQTATEKESSPQHTSSPENKDPLRKRMDLSNLRPIEVIKVDQNDLVPLPSDFLRENGWFKWHGKTASPPQGHETNTPNEVKVGNFSIQNDPSDSNESSSFSKNSPWVLHNPRLNILGVLTGSVTVIAKSSQDFESLAEELDLMITHRLPAINAFIVTSKYNRFDPFALVETLRSNPQIERVEFEIVSRNYVQ